MSQVPSDPSASADPRRGGFSFEPLPRREADGADPVIRVVELRREEHVGPFWDDEGHLSDDHEELKRWIGISRELFDEVMAWNTKVAPLDTATEPGARHEATRQDLVERLRREVHPGIEVR